MSVIDTCWKEGCEEPVASLPDRITYWCLTHDTERRKRISEAMARLKNDSQGNPRITAGTHDITVSMNPAHLGYIEQWWWQCTCGKESGSFAKTKSIASAGAARHIRATTKAAA